MKKYSGAILDDDGFIVFEFTLPFVGQRRQSVDLARKILYAWRATHDDQDYYYTLEED